MEKRNIFVALLFFLAVTATFFVAFPETLARMEVTDYFVWEHDFLIEKISEAPGLTSLLSNFLLQFFRWIIVGAVIEGLLAAAMLYVFSLILKAMNRKGIPVLGILLPLFFISFAPFQLDVLLEGLFFLLSIWFGVKIQKSVLKGLYVVLLSVLGFFLIPWPMLLLAISFIAVDSYLQTRKMLVPGACIVAVAVSVAVVFLSNNLIGFIPFGHRFFYSPVTAVGGWLFFAIILVSLALFFVPELKAKNLKCWLPYTLALLVVGGSLFYVVRDQNLRNVEKSYHYARLADLGKWQQLIDEIPIEETGASKAALVYSLLAQSELGLLPEKIFTYPLPNMDEIYYRQPGNEFCCDFNRKFFECLGFYDEAFHQSVIQGVACRDGLCFGALRHMAYYKLLEGEKQMAGRYTDLLARSTCNSKFVKSMRRAIARKTLARPDKPVISNSFIGASAWFLEARMLMDRWPKDKKLLDYYLCGLLLERQPVKFSQALGDFGIYKAGKMPRAYAEALAMAMQSNTPQYAAALNPSYDVAGHFLQFYGDFQKHPDPKSMSSYRGSYWYFFYCTPVLTRTQE